MLDAPGFRGRVCGRDRVLPLPCRRMRVLILGGDGYLGWPTALRFSDRGHEVAVVDNFARRRWHLEQSTDSLTPLPPLVERISAWNEISGHEIEAHIGDIADGEFLDAVIPGFHA